MLPRVIGANSKGQRRLLRDYQLFVGPEVNFLAGFRGRSGILGVALYRLLRGDFKFFGHCVFRFNLFLFLLGCRFGGHRQLGGCLRYFFILLILFSFFLAVRADEVEILVLDVVVVRQAEARRVEPLVAVVAGNHVVRLRLLANAIKLGRIDGSCQGKLVVNHHDLLLRLCERLGEAGTLVKRTRALEDRTRLSAIFLAPFLVL